MIHIQDLKLITEQAQNKNKIDIWWDLSRVKLDEYLLSQAKLGRHYLTIGQSSLKWMSVPDFRQKVKMELEANGYSVKELGGNYIQVKWN